jgi:hypothetical protein
MNTGASVEGLGNHAADMLLNANGYKRLSSDHNPMWLSEPTGRAVRDRQHITLFRVFLTGTTNASLYPVY